MTEIIEAVEARGANGLVLSSLQEVAWTTNLRGSDGPFIPVFKSYLFINTSKSMILYVDPKKVTDQILAHLGADTENCTRSICAEVRPYDEFLNDLYVTGSQNSSKILVPDSTNFASFAMIPEEHKLSGSSPVATLKAVKNSAEIQGMRLASIRDSVALIETLSIIEKDLTSKKPSPTWNELSVSDLISKLRKEQDNNRGDSFPNIAAVGRNAAKAHYVPSNDSKRTLTGNEVFLLDTGGQYLEGTTDVTRTVHFGNPSDFEKEAYTRVLMGLIDLTTVKFPAGVMDVSIPDSIARRPLMDVGLQYDHGTGHGIGVFLDVHENSLRIGVNNGFRMSSGMITSIEPGYYERGNFGIRIENAVLTTKATGIISRPDENINKVNHYEHQSDILTDDGSQSKQENFLMFETLTLVPLEPKLFKMTLMTWRHRKWINEYNSKIRTVIGKELTRLGKTDALKWMREKTVPLPESDCQARESSSPLSPNEFSSRKTKNTSSSASSIHISYFNSHQFLSHKHQGTFFLLILVSVSHYFFGHRT